MQTIAQHIERLLREQECVIVAGLGGFVTQRQSAYVSDGMLNPPSYRVGFNALLNHEDGLLAQSLMQEREISFVEASALVREEVNVLLETVNAGQKYELGRIGSFVKTAEGNLDFTPMAAVYLPENMAMPMLRLPEMIAVETAAEAEKTKDTIHITLSRRMLRYASIVAVVLGLSMAPLHNQTSQKAGFFVPTWECDTMRVTPAPVEEAVEEVAEMPKVEKFVLAPNVVPSVSALYGTGNSKTKPEQKNEKRHHVIIASLPSRQSAEHFIDQLILEEGDEPQVLVVGEGETYRVSLRSFSLKDEALGYIEYVRQTRPNMRRAWMLRQ